MLRVCTTLDNKQMWDNYVKFTSKITLAVSESIYMKNTNNDYF